MRVGGIALSVGPYGQSCAVANSAQEAEVSTRSARTVVMRSTKQILQRIRVFHNGDGKGDGRALKNLATQKVFA